MQANPVQEKKILFNSEFDKGRVDKNIVGNIELLEITLMIEIEEGLLANKLMLISPASINFDPGHCKDILVNIKFKSHVKALKSFDGGQYTQMIIYIALLCLNAKVIYSKLSILMWGNDST